TGQARVRTLASDPARHDNPRCYGTGPLKRLATSLGVAAAGLAAWSTPASADTATFTFTGGEQRFSVPAGVTSVSVVAVGAVGGGNAKGGRGGTATGTIAVTPGTVLYV